MSGSPPVADLAGKTGVPATFEEWLARDAVACTDEGIDRMLATMPDVEVLGFGEALHGGEEILQLRNRLFRRLVDRHGFRAIAIESSFPQSRFVNDYVCGGGDAPNLADWMSNGMGLLEANRELVEWIRRHNAGTGDAVHFFGFDMPLGRLAFASPRLVLERVYAVIPERGERIESLIGADADWENPAVIGDPSKGVGGTPRANDLRIEVEELVADLRRRGPEFDAARGADALHDAQVARQLLAAHAAMARRAGYAEVLGIRDTIMADNLLHILALERGHGRLLVFAAQRPSEAGPDALADGRDNARVVACRADVSRSLSRRYAVIGTGLGVSADNGIGSPEPGSLEARFTDAMLVPTASAPLGQVAGLPSRTGSARNLTYFPWTSEVCADFDWLAFVPDTTYQRGGPPLHAWEADRGPPSDQADGSS